MAALAQLCQCCQATFSGFRTWSPSDEYAHQPSLNALQLSSEELCPLCQWLLLAVADARRSNDSVEALIASNATGRSRLITRCNLTERHGWYSGDEDPALVDWSGSNFMVVQFLLTQANDYEALAHITVHLQVSENAEGKPVFEPEAYTGAPASLALAKRWLGACRRTHTTCQAGRNMAWRPSRLLRLSPSKETDQSPVLREAVWDEYDNGVEYVTLSHRWAPGKQLQLLTTNHEQLRQAIPVEELKASIQDAFTVAQHIGVEYIWIDTLCIMQDDNEDRGHEVLLMDRVYGNSICNVSASEAESNGQGCFHARHESLVKAFSVCLGANSPGQVRHVIRREWGSSREVLDTCVLARRAWVFQERMLSPRVLHCCKQELHWECRELEASETYPDGKPESASWAFFQKSSLKTDMLNRTVSSSTSDEIEEARQVWRRVVSTYTSCALTFPEDKLRALAGITYVWQRLHDDEYIVGFWRSSILGDLLWWFGPEDNPSPPRRIPLDLASAPSWSWASMQGTVSFLLDGYFSDSGELQVRLLGISRRTPTVSPLEGNDGHERSHSARAVMPVLHVRGRCVPARWMEHQNDHMANTGVARLLVESAADEPASGKAYDRWNNYVTFDDPSAWLPEEILCLSIFIDQPGGVPRIIHGLVLTVPIGDAQESWRLGFFNSTEFASFDVPEIELTLC